MANPDELKEVLALMQAIAAAQKKSADLTAEQSKDVASMSHLFTRDEAQLERLADQRRRNHDKAKEENDDLIAEKMQAEEALFRFIIEKKQALGSKVEEQAAEARKLNKEKIGDNQKAADLLRDNAAISQKASKDTYVASASYIGKIHDAQIAALTAGAGGAASTSKKTASSVKNMFGEAMKGASGLGGAAMKLLGELGGEVIGMGADVLKKQAQIMMTATKGIISDLDSQYSAYRKKVGIDLPNAQKAFLGVMDDGAKLARNWNESNDSLSSGLKIISDIYIDPSEAGIAMQNLTTGVSNFSKIMDKTPELGTLMANNVAALSKLGVAQSSTTKTMEIGSKAMGMTGVQMVKLTRQITGTGIALDRDLNQVMGDFNSMAPQLTQFGDKMVDVFANLEAQSKATGIAAGDLLSTAMKFDTFEGAAKAAGKLNAILGDTVVDTMALIHASPDEKIDILRQSLKDAGKEFDQLHRREQDVIASSLNLGSVMQAQQFFNKDNADAYDDFAKKVDTGQERSAAASDDALKGLARSAASITDILNGAASNMASIMIGATNVIRAGADTAYSTVATTTDAAGGVVNLITDTFSGHQDTVEKAALNSQKATDSIVKNTKKVKKAKEEMKGSIPIAEAAAKKPAEKPAPVAITRIDAKAFEEMKKQSDGFNESLSKLPANIAALQKSLQSLMLKRELFGDIVIPGDPLSAIKPSTSAPMTREVQEARSPAPEVAAQVLDSAKKIISPTSAMPVEVVKDYREEIQRTQTLDRTNYIETITEVHKKQEAAMQSNADLIAKIQGLADTIGERAALDAAEKFDITLKIGNTEFDAKVIEALARTQ